MDYITFLNVLMPERLKCKCTCAIKGIKALNVICLRFNHLYIIIANCTTHKTVCQCQIYNLSYVGSVYRFRKRHTLKSQVCIIMAKGQLTKFSDCTFCSIMATPDVLRVDTRQHYASDLFYIFSRVVCNTYMENRFIKKRF